MRKPKRRKITAKWAQQKMLERLRVELATEGYAIFPIAKSHRRHQLDFVAVLKEPPMNFLVVRPTLKDRVSVTPYGPWSQYGAAYRAIGYARSSIDISICRSPRQLKMSPPDKGWWKEYLPKNVRGEVQILLGLD